MKRAKFTEEQVIGILKEQEAGAKTADVCRRHGVSGATFYKWKAKYGGLEISEAMDWAAERYAYRSRIGQHSKSLGGQETMAFIVKDIPDFVVSALSPYRRVVMP